MRRFQIPIKYQSFQHPQITRLMKQRVMEQLTDSNNDGGISVYGHKGIYKQFEEQFGTKMGLTEQHKKYCYTTCSGTSALYGLYYGSLKYILKSRSKAVSKITFIVPSYTFFATVTPLVHLINNYNNYNGIDDNHDIDTSNINIEFADCNVDNGNVNSESILKIVEKIDMNNCNNQDNTAAVLVLTHMWGLPCDMNEIVDICNKYNILLISDLSHAHGSEYNNKSIGYYSDCNAWSLQGKKIITSGEGGILSTNNEYIFNNALLLSEFNRRCKEQIANNSNYEYSMKYNNITSTGFGLKLKANPLGIAMAYSQIENNNFENMLMQRQQCGMKIQNFIENNYKKSGLTNVYCNKSIEYDRDILGCKSSYYALPILFDESYFKCDKNTFVNQLIETGLTSADIPGTTVPLNNFDIFKPFIEKTNQNGQFENAQKFQKQMFKIDVAYGDEWETYADYYLEALDYVYSKNVK